MALMCHVVQAQVSEQEVWNISEQEVSTMKAIELAWYGNYAGSNSLGMAAFAEAFNAPEQESKVTEVKVYFAKTATVTPDADIAVSVVLPGDNGEPTGDILASATIKASELIANNGKTGAEIEPTVFSFAEAPLVSSNFFVVIEGFPNNNGDDIAIACVRRNAGKLCTAWHYLEIEDANYQPTGEYKWYLNSNDPTTLGIAVHMQWGTEKQEEQEEETGISVIANGQLMTDNSVPMYNLSGQQVDKNFEGIVIRNGKRFLVK